MTTEERTFSASDIAGKNTFLTGDPENVLRTCRIIIETWDKTGRMPLVVYDQSGKLYSEYGNDAILVDLESGNAVLPDPILPVLASRRYGGSAAMAALAIKGFLVQDRAIQNTNDAFFSMSAGKTLVSEQEYYLALARLDYRHKGADSCNTLLSFAGDAHDMHTLMHGIAYNTGGFAPRCEPQSNQKGPLPYSANYLPDEEKNEALIRYVTETYGRSATPFDDTLKTVSNSVTSSCILKERLMQGKNFDALLNNLKFAMDRGAEFKKLDLSAYIRDTGGKMLFLCGGKDADAYSALAALMTLGLAAAAETEGVHVSVLVPEADRWNLLHVMEQAGKLFSGTLSVICGCKRLTEAAKNCGMDAAQLCDMLLQQSERIVWHQTREVLTNNIFRSRFTVNNAVYAPSEMSGNGMLAIEDTEADKVRYLYSDDPERSGGTEAERTPMHLTAEAAACPWFFEEVPDEEAKGDEAPQDIFGAQEGRFVMPREGDLAKFRKLVVSRKVTLKVLRELLDGYFTVEAAGQQGKGKKLDQ